MLQHVGQSSTEIFHRDRHFLKKISSPRHTICHRLRNLQALQIYINNEASPYPGVTVPSRSHQSARGPQCCRAVWEGHLTAAVTCLDGQVPPIVGASSASVPVLGMHASPPPCSPSVSPRRGTRLVLLFAFATCPECWQSLLHPGQMIRISQEPSQGLWAGDGRARQAPTS